jgi:hypothetical protein
MRGLLFLYLNKNLEWKSLLTNFCIFTVGGGAYTLGRLNSDHCWHLFTTDNPTDGLKIPDQTLEVSSWKYSISYYIYGV